MVRNVIILYLVVLHVIPIFTMLGLGALVPGNLLSAGMAAVTLWLTLIYALDRVQPNAETFTLLDGLVGAYAVYSLASFFLYFQPGHPATPVAFVYGVDHLLLPLPLFFAVKLVSPRDQRSIIKTICVLNVGMVVAGLLLFYLRPAFYTTYLTNYFEESRNLVTQAVLYVRLNSYVGSTAVGILSALTMVLISHLRIGRVATAAAISLLVVAAVLSQQRGGLLGGAMALAYYLAAGHGRLAGRVALIAVLFAVIAGVALFFEARYPGLLAYSADKAFSSGSALSERFHSYRVGWNYFLRFPFGLGLGATSSAVYNAGLIVGEEVTDANMARILADLGAVGVTLFLVLLSSAFVAALRTGRDALAWLAVLAIYSAISLGTNVFDSFYVAHLFWLLCGIIDSRAARRAEAR